jgi:hypothetical protein
MLWLQRFWLLGALAVSLAGAKVGFDFHVSSYK